MLNVFLNTWGNYNVHGADGGEWITLPMDAEELEETLNRIASAMGDHDPEWAIHDYEWTTELEFFEISEYDSITKLNEQLQEMENLSEYDQEEIAAAVEAFGYSFPEAMERQQGGYFIFYPGQTLEDVAYDLVNECYFDKNTPDILTRYFDYEAFAHDLSFDGYTETKYGVIVDN